MASVNQVGDEISLIETFQYDWTSVYNNEEELRKDFDLPALIVVCRNFWILEKERSVYVLHETQKGPIREFWRVHVWNNRDPRDAIRTALAAKVYTKGEMLETVSRTT